MCEPFPTEWSRPVDGAVSEPLSESPLIAGRAWVPVSRSELAHRGSRPCCQPRLRRRTLFTVGFLMHRTHPAITWHNGQAASLCSHHPRARPLSRAPSSNRSELSRACSRDATRRYAAGITQERQERRGRPGPRAARPPFGATPQTWRHPIREERSPRPCRVVPGGPTGPLFAPKRRDWAFFRERAGTRPRERIRAPERKCTSP